MRTVLPAAAAVATVSAVTKRSAGILLYRHRDGLQLLIVHPGGPFWARRDAASWSIPKGEIDEGEDPLAAARRELGEELGAEPELVDLVDLGEIRQKAGKVVRAWGARGDFDPDALASNSFEMEWPPRSGRRQEFPEVDRAAWVGADEARRLLLPAQALFVDRLLEALGRER
jgi:predicted NUDIX family NTP pyrophosphohydrolase